MKYLLKFAIYTLLVLAPLVLLTQCLEEYYPKYRLQRERIRDFIRGGGNVFVLGSSHAAAFNHQIMTQAIGKKAISLADPGADLYEISYQIDSVSRETDRAVYVIAMSPFFFHYNNNLYKIGGVRTRNEKHFKLYAIYRNYGKIVDGDVSNLALGFLHPLINDDMFASFLDYPRMRSAMAEGLDMLFPGGAGYPVRKAGKKAKKPRPVCVPEAKARQLDRHAKKRLRYVFSRNIIPNMVGNAERPIPEATFDEFGGVISRNADDLFILFVPPYWPAYYDQIPRVMKKVFLKRLYGLGVNENVRVYDYSAFRDVLDCPCCFSNSDHLNTRGRRLFTEHFLARLEQDGVLPESGSR